jgi:diaminobutyrate-2-oxoglutarate transaminase
MQSESPVSAPDYQYIRARESYARTYANSIDRVLERGSLARLHDGHGREYLSCLSCAGTLALSHNHPYVQEQLQRFFAEDRYSRGST